MRNIELRIRGSDATVEIVSNGPSYKVRTPQGEYEARVEALDETTYLVEVGGERLVVKRGPEGLVFVGGEPVVLGDVSVKPKLPSAGVEASRRRAGGSGSGDPRLFRSSIAGRIVEVRVREGQRVEKGDVLFLMESMKMINEVKSDRSGVVEKVLVKEGDSVRKGDALLVFSQG